MRKAALYKAIGPEVYSMQCKIIYKPSMMAIFMSTEIVHVFLCHARVQSEYKNQHTQQLL